MSKQDFKVIVTYKDEIISVKVEPEDTDSGVVIAVLHAVVLKAMGKEPAVEMAKEVKKEKNKRDYYLS